MLYGILRYLHHESVLLISCTDKWKSFSMGYKEFMGGLFDENLTFLEGMYYCVYL